MRLLVWLGMAVAGVSFISADSAADSASLELEHRSAKGGDSFLDGIAHLFGAGSNNNKKQKLQQQTKPGPVYRPAIGPPRRQTAAASVQRPVAVYPPKSIKKTFYPPAPTRLATSASNISPIQQKSGFGSGPADPWQIAQPANMAQIKDLQVQCEKDLMRVRIVFDRPFYGMVFSKGHYSNVNCVHVPSGLGQTQATFDVAMGQCGMHTGGNSDAYNGAPSPQGSFIENTIIVQYDPLLQEVWDQARKMRCTWYDFYEKAVTFKPYQVDMLDPVTANFLGDNLRCWMQVQVGKGPYASEVSGIVKIGQTMTMVLGVKDDENKFDMMVRNCVAHDGTRAPIQLVDEKGCVVREKIMSPFKKVKNFDATANVLSYAYFQAFKFPDSMNVHFQCVVQVCRGSCPEPQCGGGGRAVAPTNNVDDYGAPQAPAIDSYGSPGGPAINSYSSPNGGAIDSYTSPINRVDPRIPNNNNNIGQYSSGSERRVSVVTPEGRAPAPIPLNGPIRPRPNFSKRIGIDGNGLGANPRSLDFEDGDVVKAKDGDVVAEVRRTQKSLEVEDTKKKVVEEEASSLDNSVEEKSRKRRAATDANGNTILKVVRREAAVEEEGDVDQADIETTRVIRVVAPSDVQFQLSAEGQEEVVINTNSVPTESLCLDTAAFVGVTISFLMLLIIAVITIVFLWMRIRAIDRKNLL